MKQKPIDFALYVLCLLAVVFSIESLADDDTAWVYVGGWSHHAAGVSYSTQTHNTFGVEYRDWTYWNFTNSNEDDSHFFGKSIETHDLWGGIQAGFMAGCVQGYQDECLPIVLPKLSYEMQYAAIDVVTVPGVVYKATLRVPFYAPEKPSKRFREKVGKWSLEYSAGSTGIGYGGRYRINDSWSVGIDRTGYDLDPDWGSAELGFTTATINWHPWGNGVYLAGGVVYNETSADYHQEWSRSFTVADYSATITASADAELEYAPISGYFGAGYEYRPEYANDLGWRFELGVIATGNPQIDGTARVHGVDELDALAQAVADRKLSELRDDYSYAFWPVAKVSVTYHF